MGSPNAKEGTGLGDRLGGRTMFWLTRNTFRRVVAVLDLDQPVANPVPLSHWGEPMSVCRALRLPAPCRGVSRSHEPGPYRREAMTDGRASIARPWKGVDARPMNPDETRQLTQLNVSEATEEGMK